MSDETRPQLEPLNSPLSAAEQSTILQTAKLKLRDLECEYRKQAERWHNAGACIEAWVCKEKADTLAFAVQTILGCELAFIYSKTASY